MIILIYCGGRTGSWQDAGKATLGLALIGKNVIFFLVPPNLMMVVKFQIELNDRKCRFIILLVMGVR